MNSGRALWKTTSLRHGSRFGDSMEDERMGHGPWWHGGFLARSSRQREAELEIGGWGQGQTAGLDGVTSKIGRGGDERGSTVLGSGRLSDDWAAAVRGTGSVLGRCGVLGRLRG
ncbi:hypothetical protein M0R45_001097 [Rubus argutus]|uniref:Uncharacterized protein n=1 Tax=Rubus argutus TaxID=59490 RepID=A0AAW1VMN0_RUBAR